MELEFKLKTAEDFRQRRDGGLTARSFDGIYHWTRHARTAGEFAL
jgi:hypothetical protein